MVDEILFASQRSQIYSKHYINIITVNESGKAKEASIQQSTATTQQERQKDREGERESREESLVEIL